MPAQRDRRGWGPGLERLSGACSSDIIQQLTRLAGALGASRRRQG
jgi:hypothetical protein